MSSLNAVITAWVRGTYAGTNDLASVVADFNSLPKTEITLTPGTSSGNADLIFMDTRTLAASATENLDLAGGALADPLGATLTFVTIKAIYVKAASANTNNVVVGGAGSNTLLGIFSDATDKILVKPGGVFMWVAPATGATVTTLTGDILLVANSSSGSSVTYDIVIIGTSA